MPALPAQLLFAPEVNARSRVISAKAPKGPENFKFTNISWISYYDMLGHQVAWKFFYNDIWHFPLGKNPNYQNYFIKHIKMME